MALDLFRERGVPLDRQQLSWREMVGTPISKLDDDAFSRVRIVLMNGIESDAVRFKHLAARFDHDLRLPLAQVRRADHHQQTAVNWLLGADQSPLETTIAVEQVAVEVTAAVAEREPDPYLASVYRFGLLEDFDHLYRFAALMDRLTGQDANHILQSYTDLRPGRPTAFGHRAPQDDLRAPYDRKTADPLSKIHAITVTAAALQARDYYMTIGPTFADPLARQLYAEIASIEEQHVTQYTSLGDPGESLLEKWLLHEATEACNYAWCAAQESNPRLRALWTRFCEWELGQLQVVMGLFRQVSRRDPAEVLPAVVPEALDYRSHRAFVRDVLHAEVDLRAVGADFVPAEQEPIDGHSAKVRQSLARHGAPSDIVAAAWRWSPGTELAGATRPTVEAK